MSSNSPTNSIDPKLIATWQDAVLAWYQQHGRQLPWRQTTDPYAILVSEVMLQQTQADRVIPKYQAWLAQFPTLDSLAAASPAAIIQAWAGLGYNRRALYLQRTAQAIQQLGTWPTDLKTLKSLPGLGPYTAAAVLSFAFNQDVALVDTNIKRLYQLLIFGDQIEPKPADVEAVATSFLPIGRSRDWHNALMDIGSLLSKAKGAAAQQQLLLTLFPPLSSFRLPAVSDQPLKRPKQSNFKTSRRFWRGRIIDLLRQHPRLTVEQLAHLLTVNHGPSPFELSNLLQSLKTDQLIVEIEDHFCLPPT